MEVCCWLVSFHLMCMLTDGFKYTKRPGGNGCIWYISYKAPKSQPLIFSLLSHLPQAVPLYYNGEVKIGKLTLLVPVGIVKFCISWSFVSITFNLNVIIIIITLHLYSTESLGRKKNTMNIKENDQPSPPTCTLLEE